MRWHIATWKTNGPPTPPGESPCAGGPSSAPISPDRAGGAPRFDRNRSRRGTEVLELALLLPILLLLSFGTVEFGYFFYLNHTAAGAAREGARARIPLGATDDDAQLAVSSIMSTVGMSEGSQFTSDVSVDPDTRIVTVTVTCANWDQIGVRPMGLISATRQITGVAVMRAESN